MGEPLSRLTRVGAQDKFTGTPTKQAANLGGGILPCRGVSLPAFLPVIVPISYEFAKWF